MSVLQNQMWIEAYRPETLDDVVGQDAAIDRFKRWVAEENLPHVLLAGPPGVGKTACAESYARDYYGDVWESNFREFNASDDRGIDVVRDDLKPWCRKAPADGYPFKVVFLDESDQLTSEAQHALRRVIEQFSDTTRFILSCNYASQIKGPIQSRCATMRFGRLDDDDIESLVRSVIDDQDLDAEEAAVEKIVRSARGQARDAIMTVQLSSKDGELTETDVDLFTGVVDDQLVEEILTLALDGEIDTAQRRLDVEVLKAGADAFLLVDSVFRVLRKLDLPPDHRAKCFELLATVEERLQGGLNPQVQFHALLAHVYMSQGLSPMAQQSEGSDA